MVLLYKVAKLGENIKTVMTYTVLEYRRCQSRAGLGSGWWMEVDTLPFGCPQTACLCGLFSHSMLLVGRANTNICYATVWTVVCLEDLQHILEIMSWAGTEGLTVSYLICDQWLLWNNNIHWLHDNRWCWLCGHGLAAWQQMVLALWSWQQMVLALWSRPGCMTTDGAGSVVTAWLHDNRWCWLCGHGCKSDLAISGAFWAVKFSQVGWQDLVQMPVYCVNWRPHSIGLIPSETYSHSQADNNWPIVSQYPITLPYTHWPCWSQL